MRGQSRKRPHSLHPGAHNPEDWEWIRDLIRKSELRFTNSGTGERNIFVVEAFVNPHPMAMGRLWYRYECGRALALVDCYVFPMVRRCGLLTQLHDQLLKVVPTTRQIVTGAGTVESLPWLEKTGYVYNETLGRWELNIPASSED